MSEPIDGLTTTALSLALDAASLRQQVLAANIANAGRPGHAAQRVSFEAYVSVQARGMSSSSAASPASASVDWQARLAPVRSPDGTPQTVALDEEVAALSRNALHYHALAKGLTRHLGLLALAASEGRR